jgi:hypothetical protein
MIGIELGTLTQSFFRNELIYNRIGVSGNESLIIAVIKLIKFTGI